MHLFLVMNIFSQDALSNFLSVAPELADFVKMHHLSLIPDFQDPFSSLVKAIIYQQLSGKAATVIYTRFLALFDDLSPDSLLEISNDNLRTAGLSRQKIQYVRNVASAFAEQGILYEFKSVDVLHSHNSEELIELFSQIKGVGRWTVEMYLLFSLGRLDIFSYGDLGVRKGLALMYKLSTTPTMKEAKELAVHWGNYASVGTALAWSVIEGEKGLEY